MTEPFTVVHDGFDREVFTELVESRPEISAARERLGRVLPHPDALLMDLFALLYKMTVIVRPERSLPPSALLQRKVVRALWDDPGIEPLRTQCALDAARAGEALAFLAESVATALTTGDRLVASEIIEGKMAAEQEQALAQLEAERKALADVPWDEDTKRRAARSLDDDIRQAKQQSKAQRQRQRTTAESLPVSFDHEVSGAMASALDQQGDIDDAMRAFGFGSGSGRVDGRLRADLGHRLSRSKKLRMLARLLGAFKEVALEARRNKLERSPQTVHDVGRGRALDRLLPSELLGLSNEGPLHADFLRRYAEGELLSYRLQGPKARGPMVVCVDGSSSMTGSKEIWSKAVALTLVELARRQRRRCLGIVFSAGPEIFEVELSRPTSSQRSRLEPDAVFAFADHFPGGGTSFEEPLRRALTALTERPYRRGDIVFITDGEASVPPQLVAEVDEARRRQRFEVRGIAVGEARTEALAAFADDVRRVEDLAGDTLSDLFAEID